MQRLKSQIACRTPGTKLYITATVCVCVCVCVAKKKNSYLTMREGGAPCIITHRPEHFSP